MDEGLMNFLALYGLPAIFVAILLEYACFPISSEIILPLSGAIAAQMKIPLFLVIIVSIVAGLIGCSICYLIGRCGDKFLSKVLGRFPRVARQFEKTCCWQKKNGKYAVLLGRMIPLFRTYISFASGIVKQNYIVFISFTAVGISIWNTLLIGIGYFISDGAENLIVLIQRIMIVFALVIVAVIIGKIRHNKKKKANF